MASTPAPGYIPPMNMINGSLAGRRVHPVIWGLAGVMVGLELVFSAVDAGLLNPGLDRFRVYGVFAYWDPLFEWAMDTGHVEPQLLWSFLTHALLHGGWLHLVLNLAAFLGMGHAISQLAGIRAALAIFAVCAVAGALAFSLITDHQGPLVGASGAIFGYIAVLTAWQEQALRRHGGDRSPIWQRILGLIAINVVLDLGTGGMLAWEAHLGGFIAGWLMATAFRPRLRRSVW